MEEKAVLLGLSGALVPLEPGGGGFIFEGSSLGASSANIWCFFPAVSVD